MLQLVVYVPETHTERVKEACFRAGAGRYKNYDCCSFECSGTGQFRALEGADPFTGSVGIIEKVSETRVEMICEEGLRDIVTSALREAHPYEEPAFHFISIIV